MKYNFILQKGITGFGGLPLLTTNEIKDILKYVYYPYLYSNITEPQANNNYFVVTIENKMNGIKFKLLVNAVYYIVASVTMESVWLELNFINLPKDFIEQISDDKIIILDKEILEKEVPKDELKILGKDEIRQINYWQSKTYGEIIFNGYD